MICLLTLIHMKRDCLLDVSLIAGDLQVSIINREEVAVPCYGELEPAQSLGIEFSEDTIMGSFFRSKQFRVDPLPPNGANRMVLAGGHQLSVKFRLGQIFVLDKMPSVVTFRFLYTDLLAEGIRGSVGDLRSDWYSLKKVRTDWKLSRAKR